MDLRHVRTFVTVAELGTVTQAAQHLRVAQPALSRQIADLERELGIRLFERVGRRLILSIEGGQLLSECRAMLVAARAVAERAQLLRRGDSGVLKVAASSHLIESVFPAFLRRYAQHYPDVQVKLVDVVGPGLLSMLERGDIHLAQVLVRAVPPEAKHLVGHLLQPTDMLAAVHARSSLGPGESIDIARLAEQPLLQVTTDFAIRRLFDSACRLAGFEPHVLLESRAPHALLALAEAGHGVAIIPCALRTHRYRLRILRVTHRGRPLREPLTVLSDERRPLPPYALGFCELLAAHVREVFPITRPTAANPRRRTSAR